MAISARGCGAESLGAGSSGRCTRELIWHKETSMPSITPTAHISKIDRDPRVTPGWPVLAGQRIFDEIPQLLNVLMGQMSLVGPRPVAVPGEPDLYVPWREARLSVRPGVTGLWQVCTSRSFRWRLSPMDRIRPAVRSAPILLAGFEDSGGDGSDAWRQIWSRICVVARRRACE